MTTVEERRSANVQPGRNRVNRHTETPYALQRKTPQKSLFPVLHDIHNPIAGKAQEPTLDFGNWAPWSARGRISDDLDMPADFDLCALYLFGYFPFGTPPEKADPLTESVVYIGLSRGVVSRTQHHPAVRTRYKSEFHDPDAKCLYLAAAYLPPGWNTRGYEGLTGQRMGAYLHYAERRLLFHYCQKHGRLPSLNRY